MLVEEGALLLMLLLQLLRLLLLALHVSRVFIIAEDTRIAGKKTEKRRQKGKKR